MKVRSPRHHSDRGAVLVHVAIALMAMIAVSAVAIDYGVMFVGRREIQNAADAAALSAGMSRWSPHSTLDNAQNAAMAAARANLVWGEAPDVTVDDIDIGRCPPGATVGIANHCVRVDVFRTNYQRSNGSPLPTFFAQMAGVNDQGVRASATAQLRAGRGTADCLKPWALADNWNELQNPPDEFNPPGDGYFPGFGWDLRSEDPRYGYGGRLQLYTNTNAAMPMRRGFFFPVRLDDDPNHTYEWNVDNCNNSEIGPLTSPGHTVFPDPTPAAGPYFEHLIALDPSASWNPTLRQGQGGVTGGCMSAGTCARSPRWIGVPIFDPARFANDRQATGTPDSLHIVGIAGLFIDEVRLNGDVFAYLTYYPSASISSAVTSEAEVNHAFVRNMILIR